MAHPSFFFLPPPLETDGIENPLDTQAKFLSFQPDFFYVEDLEVELNHLLKIPIILSLLGSTTCF